MDASFNPVDRLLSSRKYPIRYLFIPKCGCTFVKNLLWQLDTGEHFANGPRIHDKESEFIRASQLGVTVEQVKSEEYAFTILRNPIDRFFSLYLDKVVGDGYKRFVPLRNTLSMIGLDVNAKSAGEHRRNCHIMIDWIEQNLKGRTDLPTDPHWTPQYYRSDIIQACNLKLLLLSDLNHGLDVLLSSIVPNLKQLLNTTERYATNSKEVRNEVFDIDLRRRVNQTYRKDRELFEKVRTFWKSENPTTAQELPRASEIF